MYKEQVHLGHRFTSYPEKAGIVHYRLRFAARAHETVEQANVKWNKDITETGALRCRAITKAVYAR